MVPFCTRTLSCSPNVTVCSCVGLWLGIGFREWVPIRNIIGGAAGAQYSDDVRATTKRLCFVPLHRTVALYPVVQKAR